MTVSDAGDLKQSQVAAVKLEFEYLVNLDAERRYDCWQLPWQQNLAG